MTLPRLLSALPADSPSFSAIGPETAELYASTIFKGLAISLSGRCLAAYAVLTDGQMFNDMPAISHRSDFIGKYV